MKRILLLPLVLILILSTSFAQDSMDDKYKEKVASLDAALETLYGVISGEKGEERDWDLFRYLFAPNAKLIPTREGKDGQVSQVQFWSPDEYVERAGEYLVNNGFFEKEIHRETDTFGSLVQVFSTYESFHAASDKEPFARGINSIQLLNDGQRWWVVNIYWTSETTENPIPQNYLPE